MLLIDFIKIFGRSSDEVLRERFVHPFLLQSPDAGQRHVLPLRVEQPGGSLLLGRSSRCHLVIKDPRISSKHLELSSPRNPTMSWLVYDRGSTNGTSLNGQALRSDAPGKLKDGHLLDVGGVRLTFMDPESFLELFTHSLIDPTSSRTDDEDPATLQGSPSPRPRRFESAPSLIPLATKPLPPEAEVLLCCEPSDPFPPQVGQRAVVGRHASADLILPRGQGEVSRRHSEFERREEGVYVRDLGSTNGTILGGLCIDGSWFPVPVGASVEVGDHRIFLQTTWQDEGYGDTLVHEVPTVSPGA